jgi:hypothetical protein
MQRKPSKHLDDNRILYTGIDDNSWSIYKFDQRSHTYGLEQASEQFNSYEEVKPFIHNIVDNFNPSNINYAGIMAINVEITNAYDSKGRSFGFIEKHPITDLEAQLDMLKPTRIIDNSAESFKKQEN